MFFLGDPNHTRSCPCSRIPGSSGAEPGAACGAARYPPALPKPSDQHGSRRTERCAAGSGRLLPLAFLCPPRHVLLRQSDAAVQSQVRHGGWRGGATIPLNFQTTTSVPNPIRRGSRSEEAVPRLSLPPFCEGVCASSQGTSRPGFCPFLDASPRPHPQKAHRCPHGLQGLFPVSSSTNFFGSSGHGQILSPTLPPPSPARPGGSVHHTQLRGSPPPQNSTEHRITLSRDPIAGFQALNLLGFLTVPGTTARSPSGPTGAPGMRLPPVPFSYGFCHRAS